MVVVDPSVEQPVTNFSYVMKTNVYVYNVSSKVINYKCCHRFCDHHRGSFTRVQRIQESAIWISRVIKLFIVPYSCQLRKMCCAYADCGLLLLMYMICS